MYLRFHLVSTLHSGIHPCTVSPDSCRGANMLFWHICDSPGQLKGLAPAQDATSWFSVNLSLKCRPSEKDQYLYFLALLNFSCLQFPSPHCIPVPFVGCHLFAFIENGFFWHRYWGRPRPDSAHFQTFSPTYFQGSVYSSACFFHWSRNVSQGFLNPFF